MFLIFQTGPGGLGGETSSFNKIPVCLKQSFICDLYFSKIIFQKKKKAYPMRSKVGFNLRNDTGKKYLGVKIYAMLFETRVEASNKYMIVFNVCKTHGVFM